MAIYQQKDQSECQVAPHPAFVGPSNMELNSFASIPGPSHCAVSVASWNEARSIPRQDTEVCGLAQNTVSSVNESTHSIAVATPNTSRGKY